MAYYNELLKFKDNLAVIDDMGSRLSYQELNDLCQDIKKKVHTRTLLFSFCENSIGSLVGYVAFLYSGVVPVLLDKKIESDLRKKLLEIYRPNYLYIPLAMSEDFKELECIWQEKGYCLYKTAYNDMPQLHPDLGLLLTTSGSTGSPKLVRQSYENIQSNAQSIAEYLKIDETERPITTLPMNYTYGLSIINSHLLEGATLLMTDKTLMQREFWQFFKDEKATSFGGVPYTYEILKKLRFFRMELPSLRYMTQAGGKLLPELHREFAEYSMEKNKKFIVMYGQSEATARMAYLPSEKSLEKYGSMGIAIPGGSLELININGEIITEAEVTGELVYYGPNVTLGYAESVDDLRKGDERDGRLETGDMAKRDEDGFYYIVGRKKRFLKIFGNRVNLDETERMIKEYVKDCDCACGGVDDKLYIFLTDASDEMKGDVRHFLSEKTGLNPSAFIVKGIDCIPKNDAGKILYTKLEEFYDGI